MLAAAESLTIANNAVELRLGLSDQGIPVIQVAVWKDTRTPILSLLPDAGPSNLDDKVPRALQPTQNLVGRTSVCPLNGTPWRLVDDALFIRAECERELAPGIRLTWIVELAKQGSIVRLHCRMKNGGAESCPVEWFPVWIARWKVPGAQAVRGWRALSFIPVERPIADLDGTSWGSRLHSSDTPDNGMNPYWDVRGSQGHLYFGLEWCGGWRAELSGGVDTLGFKVFLPSNETQLVLAPGESIDGPVLMVTAIRDADEALARAEWMKQRAALAKDLYGGPPPSHPFTYNNWYTTRFNVDASFLKRQVDAMDPYKFDAFIVDAGWYKCVGDWTPNSSKFAAGEFEEILRSVKSKGALAGIWTCPQFVSASKDSLPPEVDQPPTYEKFIDGYLLDLAGCNFSRRLVEHVVMLREKYGAQWWKYDQLLFAAHTRQGVMRNVIAFQEALRAVRAKYPDLIIENCQSGGRMTNELTVLATQSQWLRDGGNNGLGHARDNISVALGALEFIFPWAANRWTNNPDQMDPNDDELLRYYCRSAMPGTWGLVADLPKITERQRDIILKEVETYRRLNELKADYLYEVELPKPGAQVASITFYNRTHSKAAAIIYRWDAEGAFEHDLTFPLFASTPSTYDIEDIDTGKSIETTSDLLVSGGIPVSFTRGRLSALLFISVK
jgi:hypothetical protein